MSIGLYDMLDKELPGWGERYHELMRWGGRPLNKEERDKIKSLLEQPKNNPDEDDIGVPNRLEIRKKVGVLWPKTSGETFDGLNNYYR